MKVVATRGYDRRARKLLTAAERAAGELEIALAPTAWPVIAGTGGARKARVARGARGKSGGARIVYYVSEPARRPRSDRHLRQERQGAFDRCREERNPPPRSRRSRPQHSALGRRLIAGLKEAVAHSAARSTLPSYTVEVPEDVDVDAVRRELGLSQAAFARTFGLDVTAIHAWEQGRRRPDRAARVLLAVIAKEPQQPLVPTGAGAIGRSVAELTHRSNDRHSSCLPFRSRSFQAYLWPSSLPSGSRRSTYLSSDLDMPARRGRL